MAYCGSEHSDGRRSGNFRVLILQESLLCEWKWRKRRYSSDHEGLDLWRRPNIWCKTPIQPQKCYKASLL
ncbi:hypothetical protein SDJN02_01351, partial [Cucurbita argyrosperma subsp. argyrosperma]